MIVSLIKYDKLLIPTLLMCAKVNVNEIRESDGYMDKSNSWLLTSR